MAVMEQTTIPQRVRNMYAMYEQGNTLEDVANAFGVTRQSVSYMFKRHGLERRRGGRPKGPGRGRPTDRPFNFLHDLRLERGMTTREVAERIDQTQPNVSRVEHTPLESLTLRTIIRFLEVYGYHLNLDLIPMEDADGNEDDVPGDDAGR